MNSISNTDENQLIKSHVFTLKRLVCVMLIGHLQVTSLELNHLGPVFLIPLSIDYNLFKMPFLL